MLRVPDVRATIAWYQGIGFTLVDSFEDDGEMVWAQLSMGGGMFALSTGGHARDVTLWLTVTDLEAMYAELSARSDLVFDEKLYRPFYGGQQFSLRDNNEVAVVFHQLDVSSAPDTLA